VLLRQLPAGSALSRSTTGTSWSQEDELLAGILDTLRSGNWQRGGGKGPRPKPLRRPGSKSTKTIGTPVAIDEMRQILDSWDDPPEVHPPPTKKAAAKKAPAAKKARPRARKETRRGS